MNHEDCPSCAHLKMLLRMSVGELRDAERVLRRLTKVSGELAGELGRTSGAGSAETARSSTPAAEPNEAGIHSFPEIEG